MMFDSSLMDSEMVWILGIYVLLVWDIVICKKKVLKLETVKSEYYLKYSTHQTSNMPSLATIWVVDCVECGILRPGRRPWRPGGLPGCLEA